MRSAGRRSTKSTTLSHLMKVAGLIISVHAAPATAQTLEAQRLAFKSVYPAAERGEWAPVEAHATLLKNYVLWPDLRAAWLRANGDSEDEIREFLATWDMLKPAREIRYRYARRLARQSRDADFLALYDQYYATLGEPVLDCTAARAELKLERREAAIEKAYDGDFSTFHQLTERLMRPFEYSSADQELATPPLPAQIVQQTFCGT